MLPVVLYTHYGHKMPVDLEAQALPPVIVAADSRLFAVVVTPSGELKVVDGRTVYLEIVGHVVDTGPLKK